MRALLALLMLVPSIARADFFSSPPVPVIPAIPAYGTAATQNTGTSGATVPLNNGNNVFSGSLTLQGPLASSGGKPTLSSCPGALSASATDLRGSVTESGTLQTSCSVVFAGTYPAAPECVVSAKNTLSIVSVAAILAGSTVTLTVTNVALTGGIFTYHCIW